MDAPYTMTKRVCSEVSFRIILPAEKMVAIYTENVKYFQSALGTRI